MSHAMDLLQKRRKYEQQTKLKQAAAADAHADADAQTPLQQQVYT
jgi:hypothetical protein